MKQHINAHGCAHRYLHIAADLPSRLCQVAMPHILSLEMQGAVDGAGTADGTRIVAWQETVATGQGRVHERCQVGNSPGNGSLSNHNNNRLGYVQPDETTGDSRADAQHL